MTKEEALKVFRSYTIWDLMDNFTTDELQEMIDAIVSTPSLPSNLDGAAEDMLDDAAYDWVMGNFGNPKESLFDFDCRCFKAGAEWMVGQGYTREVDIKEDACGYPYIPCIELYDYDKEEPLFKPGDKVVVQIRKK